MPAAARVLPPPPPPPAAVEVPAVEVPAQPVPQPAPLIQTDPALERLVNLLQTLAGREPQLRERGREPWRIVAQARQMGVVDFQGGFQPAVAEGGIRKLQREFNALQLTDEEKLSHLSFFLSDRAATWFDRVWLRIGAALTWTVLVDEFRREYVSEGYRGERQQTFMTLVQGNMTVEEYVDKFDELYQYSSELFSTEELKIARFK